MNTVLKFLGGIFALVQNGVSNRRARRVLEQRVSGYPLDDVGRMVVYTAIFGGKDKLREVNPVSGVDYVCFTNDRSLRSGCWKIVVAEDDPAPPRMRAKIAKILPHRYFPDYEYSLWVDGTHTPAVDPRYLVVKYLKTNDIAMFRHPVRDCLYDEMDACLKYNKGNAADIRRQRDRYREEGYPPHNGLATCSIILRRHRSDHLVQAMEDWWEQINRFSERDQISFNYVKHRHRLNYTAIPGHVYNNHYFHFQPHKRPDSSVLSVGWILNGSREVASARIMGDNVHEYLLSRGVFSKVLFRPQTRITSRLQLARNQLDEILNHNINVLVIVKLDNGRNLDYLITQCRKLGIRVVYAVCDKPAKRMLAAADAVIATSEVFRDVIPRKHHDKLHVVFDGYEHDATLQKSHSPNRELRLCLLTNHVWDAVPCIPKLPAGVSLKIIGPGPGILATSFRRSRVFRDSAYDFEYVPWNEHTVIEEILECDAGIIPWPEMDQAVRLKSANRLMLFMSLGLPVIASPVPSYLPIVRQGENGFIADGTHEWMEYIQLLLDEPARRQGIGSAARNDVVERFSKDRQGALYHDILENVLGYRQMETTPLERTT